MSGGPTPWQTFLKANLNCTVACDFLCKSVWTPFGKKTAFLMVFIHLGSRRVFASPSTYHPDANWVQQQGRNILLWADEEDIDVRFLIRDNDAKFTQAFDALFGTEDIHIVKTPIRVPVANAYAESWIGSFKRECLNHFLCFSLRHLDHIAHAYSGYYNHLRPHQSLGNVPLAQPGLPRPEPPPYSLGPVCRIERRKILGGLLNHYEQKAA